MSRRCVECGRADVPLVEVDRLAICYDCIGLVCGGAVPERITDGDAGPIYWYWCVCGRQVRRGAYSVDLNVVAALWFPTDKHRERELDRIEDYRLLVEGIPSAGVMLCFPCAAAAGVPLLAPAPPRYPSNVINLRPGA